MIRRHLRIVRANLRVSLLLALQYRAELWVDAVLSLFWTATAILPLALVFEERSSIAGHTYPEALVVLGVFTALQGVLEAAIQPSLGMVVESVRTGALDFVLLKPADAQVLVSTARFAPLKATNVLAGLAIVAFALARRGLPVAPLDVALGALLLVGAVVILYSLWILVVSASFYVGRVDNLRYLFAAVFDAARWPSSVYRGAVAFLFTFVIPLTVMTTVPAEALLGILEPRTLAASLVGTVAFALLARLVFLRSLARYTSASS